MAVTVKFSDGAAEETTVRSRWPRQGVWLGRWSPDLCKPAPSPSPSSTRGQQSATELPSARRAASLHTHPLLCHAVLGKLSSLNSGHFMLRFFSFPLPGVTGLWMRSKYICNNRQLSGKYKRRYLKLSGHAVRLKHCWQ